MAAGEGQGDGMSMREKALLKRRIHKQHNSNFKAGYVPINETYLHKTGLRGRKSYIVYGIVTLLFLVALGNLMVTVILLSVLRISYGMEGLEFLPAGQLLKFLVPSDFASIVPVDGHIGGFANQDLHISGSNGEEVQLEASATHPVTVSLRPGATIISNVSSFHVINPNTSKTVFSSDYTGFGLPVTVNSLSVQKARLTRVSSPVDKPLTIITKRQIKLVGSEGVRISSREVVWSANKDIVLKSINGSIRMNGTHGVTIPVIKFPLSDPIEGQPPLQYKICVCKKNNRLFRIPVTDNMYDCSSAVVSGRMTRHLNICPGLLYQAQAEAVMLYQSLLGFMRLSKKSIWYAQPERASESGGFKICEHKNSH